MANYVRFYPAELAKVLNGPNGPVAKEIQRRTLLVHGRAVKLCPVDSGRLRSSLRWTMGRDSKGVVGIVSTDVNYAYLVHQGTRPHVIRPRHKKALTWKGAAHPVRIVQHPGTKPNQFLLTALKAAA